jgi:hypothetical protein
MGTFLRTYGTPASLATQHGLERLRADSDNKPDIYLDTSFRLGARTGRTMFREIDELAIVERAQIAQETTDPELLDHLTYDSELFVKVMELSNPSVTVEQIQRLSKDPDLWVRRAVAISPFTPSSILTALASDDCVHVRNAVTLNPSASQQIIEIVRLSEETSALSEARRLHLDF